MYSILKEVACRKKTHLFEQVFSQFTGFLDLIEIALDRDKFPWVRLDGSMSEKQRTKALKQFSTPSEKPRVFIISLRAGGVGLNLTSANHVFMVCLLLSCLGSTVLTCI
jgi:SNF2 family DNA or RNA helicase